MCNLLETILEFRLRLRVGGVLRALCATASGSRVLSPSTPANSTRSETGVSRHSESGGGNSQCVWRRSNARNSRQSCSGSLSASLALALEARRAIATAPASSPSSTHTERGGWQRLKEDDHTADGLATAPDPAQAAAVAAAPAPASEGQDDRMRQATLAVDALIRAEQLNYAKAAGGGLASHNEVAGFGKLSAVATAATAGWPWSRGHPHGVNIFRELRRGAEILSWQRGTMDAAPTHQREREIPSRDPCRSLRSLRDPCRSFRSLGDMTVGPSRIHLDPSRSISMRPCASCPLPALAWHGVIAAMRMRAHSE